jgi:hypothetical protein
MNRTARGDYMERLLYKCFVTIDERSTVGQLSEVLQIEESLVCHAMSLFLRLGFAEKKSAEEVQGAHSSWSEYATLHGHDNGGQTKALLLGNAGSAKRIGFLFDSQLTAFLMMGNLAEGLKKHAVMLYEVGKLADEQLDSFLHDLDEVQVQGDEGEAMRYFEHAITLKETLKTLRLHPSLQSSECDGKLDMLRLESLAGLEDDVRSRVLSKNYAVLFSMAPMSRPPPVSPLDHVCHFGPCVVQVCSPWWKLFLASLLGNRFGVCCSRKRQAVFIEIMFSKQSSSRALVLQRTARGASALFVCAFCFCSTHQVGQRVSGGAPRRGLDAHQCECYKIDFHKM